MKLNLRYLVICSISFLSRFSSNILILFFSCILFAHTFHPYHKITLVPMCEYSFFLLFAYAVARLLSFSLSLSLSPSSFSSEIIIILLLFFFLHFYLRFFAIPRTIFTFANTIFVRLGPQRFNYAIFGAPLVIFTNDNCNFFQYEKMIKPPSNMADSNCTIYIIRESADVTFSSMKWIWNRCVCHARLPRFILWPVAALPRRLIVCLHVYAFVMRASILHVFVYRVSTGWHSSRTLCVQSLRVCMCVLYSYVCIVCVFCSWLVRPMRCFGSRCTRCLWSSNVAMFFFLFLCVRKHEIADTK